MGWKVESGVGGLDRKGRENGCVCIEFCESHGGQCFHKNHVLLRAALKVDCFMQSCQLLESDRAVSSGPGRTAT